jgi:hypothetical protein
MKGIMTKEYEIIREGLIALLCVGDPVRYLHSGVNTNCIITTQYIGEIVGDTFSLSNGMIWHNFEEIEYYNGMLYVWGSWTAAYPFRSSKRYKKLVSMANFFMKS